MAQHEKRGSYEKKCKALKKILPAAAGREVLVIHMYVRIHFGLFFFIKIGKYVGIRYLTTKLQEAKCLHWAPAYFKKMDGYAM